MTELRRFDVRSSAWLSFRTSLFIGILVACVVAVIALPLTYFLSDGQVTDRLVASLRVALAIALVTGACIGLFTFFGWLQPLIYNAIAHWIGGLRFTLEKKKKEFALVGIDIGQYMKWYGISAVAVVLILFPVLLLISRFTSVLIPAQLGRVFSFAAHWPFIAGLTLQIVVGLIVSTIGVLVLLWLYNRYGRNIPVSLGLSAQKGHVNLTRFNYNLVWWFAISYGVQFLVQAVFTLFGVLPTSGESLLIEIASWVFILIFAPIAGMLIGAILVLVYNWGARKYGPVRMEFR
jgi:hypothetical protein